MDRLSAYEILKDARNGIIKQDYAKRIARMVVRQAEDPLSKSIMKDWRVHGSGNYCANYIIYEDSGESDDEIHDFVDSMRVENNVPYDCSGAWFTTSIRWFRCKAGIAIIHRLARAV